MRVLLARNRIDPALESIVSHQTGGFAMWQVIADALGNRQIVIFNNDADAGCRIGGDAGAARVVHSSVISSCARRGATLLWITAALLTTAWTVEARGSSASWYSPAGAVGIEQLRASGLTAKSMRLAQAEPDSSKELQKALE